MRKLYEASERSSRRGKRIGGPVSTEFGPSIIPSGSGYRVNFVAGGTRYRKTFSSIDDARQFIADVYSVDTAVQSDLRDSIRQYLNWSERDKKKGASWLVSLRQILYDFTQFLAGRSIKRVRDVGIKDFRAYREHWLRAEKHRSDNTWEKYRQAISSWLRWESKRDPKVVNIAADEEFRRSSQKNVPETLDPQEITAIFQYFDSTSEHYARAFRILLYTGIRLGELIKLRWSDITFEPEPFLRCGTKSKQQRTVPIPDKLMPYLDRCKTCSNAAKGAAISNKANFVMDDGYGRPLYSPKQYHTALTRACVVMGLRHHTVHSLRHSFARYMLESGCPINYLKDIMGHSDIRTTAQYVRHFSLSHAREQMNRLSF